MALVPGLYTVVKNNTDSARTFGFLGPRGRRLDAGESVFIPGDLVATLGNAGRGNQRRLKALEKALYNGTLVMKSPALYLEHNGSYSEVVSTGTGDGVGVTGPNGWD